MKSFFYDLQNNRRNVSAIFETRDLPPVYTIVVAHSPSLHPGNEFSGRKVGGEKGVDEDSALGSHSDHVALPRWCIL